MNSHFSTRTPILGCIADDVTGATDLAINLVQGGMRVVQVLGILDEQTLASVVDADAIVVALKTRSIAKQEAIAQSLASLKSLRSAGIPRFYFKYCSTFDSTERGNIGPVAEALMEELHLEQTIFCPAFPRAGRTVYMGHLFVGDKLLSESGMQNHPLNPMTDANLVRCLARQASRPVGLLSNEFIDSGAVGVRDRLEQLKQQGVVLIVTDTCDDSHLASLAGACVDQTLVTGGSGLGRFLPAAYRQSGLLKSEPFVPTKPCIKGRSLIVAGSCSLATNAQVQFMHGRCPVLPIDVAAIIANPETELGKVIDWAKSSDPAQPLLVTSSSPPDQVARLQDRYGVEVVALAVESFLASVTAAMVAEMNVRRLVLAGGETSGAIVAKLGIRSLQIGPEICAGVPWTETIGREQPLALALKSGNFGNEDFFQTALEMLA